MAGLFAVLVVAALCSSAAVASSKHHGHKPVSKHHHSHHHRRHKPVRPKPGPITKPKPPTTGTPGRTGTLSPPPSAPGPTDPAPNPPTPAPVKAHLAIVSNTPNVTHATVGDLVTFTIVAENYGPDAVQLWFDLIQAPGIVTCAWNTSAEGCGEGPVVRPDRTITLTVTQQVPPTSSAYDTACAYSPDLSGTAPQQVANNPDSCKTATVAIDTQPCPTSVPGVTQTLDGNTYKLEGEDTFTKDAPVGSFASTSMDQVVYTGDHGMGWTEYPDGWPSTWSGHAEGYQPSTVQSVHDGVLDFGLHRDFNGNPVGASISPVPSGTNPPGYQVYGAWSFCERVPPDDPLPSNGYTNDPLFGYHQAPLLWPQDDKNWQWAESDFPEADLWTLADFSAFAHYGGQGAQDPFRIAQAIPLYDPHQWHVYTQTWGPGFRTYYVDGQCVGRSTNQVWSGPERWQLQLEPAVPNPNPDYVAGAGHVYVKWVWIGTLS